MPTRILLIDDDQVDRTAVRRALAKSGLDHELTEASNGVGGLQLAQANAFDCVLLDYRLPDVDTFELLASLLSPAGGNQAVSMLTGEDDPDVAFRLMRAGPSITSLRPRQPLPALRGRSATPRHAASSWPN
jgi:two-component system sensor histidine kinase/response regulator